MKSDAKSLAANAFFLLASLAVSLLFAELALGLLFPLEQRYVKAEGVYLYKPHEVFAWKKPEFYSEYRTNGEGFAGPDYAREKPAGVKRVVFLGDSFTEGTAVPESDRFAFKVQRLTSGIEPLNFGVSGTGTVEQGIILEKFALKYDPDLVVLVFFVNDVQDNQGFERVQNSFLRSLRKDLSAASLLYRFSHQATVSVMDAVTGRKPAFSVALEETSEGREQWEETLEALRRVKSAAESNNAKFLLVYMPSQEEVHDEALEEFAERYGVGKEGLKFELPRELLGAFALENGVEFLDLTPRFKQMATRPGEYLYYPADGHINEKGHAAAAEALALKIEELV